MRRILVLRGGALGDFIVTLPALALLRRRWPTAHIELVGNATAGRLALNRQLVNAVHSQHEARWSHLYGESLRLPPELDSWLGEFDLVVNFWPDPDGTLRGCFPRHPGQVFLAAPALPTAGPAAAHYCSPLAALGLTPSELVHPLYPIEPYSRGAAAGESATVFIHPGSGSPRKNWPVERWRELIATLGAPVTLILGEAEIPGWQGYTGPGVSQLCQPSLEALVAHFRTGRAFLGHDSGISHLAAACGLPGVLLFGPTDPAVWAPPTPTMRVLHRRDLASLPASEVLAAARALLADPP